MISFGAIGNQCDGNFNKSFDLIDIVFAFFGQVVPVFDAADIAFPAGHGFQHGLCTIEVCGVGEICNFFSIHFICHAESLESLLEIVEVSTKQVLEVLQSEILHLGLFPRCHGYLQWCHIDL